MGADGVTVVGGCAHADRVRTAERAGARQKKCSNIHRVGKGGLSLRRCSHFNKVLTFDLGEYIGGRNGNPESNP